MPRSTLRGVLLLAGVSLTLFWVRSVSPDLQVGSVVRCLRYTGRICEPDALRDQARVLDALRERTPEGARIVTTTPDLAPIIRDYARRPVVHDWRDISVYLYARRGLLETWQRRIAEEERATALPGPTHRFVAYMRFAERVGADHAVLHARFLPPALPPATGEFEGHTVLWRGNGLAIVRVARPPQAIGVT